MHNIAQRFKGSIKGKTVSIIALAILISFLGSHPAAGSCDIVTGDLLFADKDINWNIRNSGSSPITICSISINWPAQNGNLLSISIDTPVIFNENRNPPQTTINSGWSGQENKRTINPGQTSVFKMTFANTARTTASDYIIKVNFCPCIAEYPKPPSSACSIIGPDIVCEFDNVWHNASNNEVSPYSYTYNWKVDNSIAGSGKNMRINWGPYSSGIHTLFLNVTETYGISSYYNQSSKQVRVVKKPIVRITIQS